TIYYDDVQEKEKVVGLGQTVIDSFDEITSAYAAACAIETEYPDSTGGRCLREMLQVGLSEEVRAAEYLKSVRRRVAEMKRRAS
ncbi:MAG: hypothetical protein V3S41_04520, partial [Spirochaetia bacterium]